MKESNWLKKTVEIFGVDEPGEVASYCWENWKEDVEHVLRTADDACENTFLFDYRWDMERTWEPVHFDGEIDWSRTVTVHSPTLTRILMRHLIHGVYSILQGRSSCSM